MDIHSTHSRNTSPNDPRMEPNTSIHTNMGNDTIPIPPKKKNKQKTKTKTTNTRTNKKQDRGK